MTPQPFTVVLMRPDYVASTFGQDVYTAHVEAAHGKHAVIVAQNEALAADIRDNWNIFGEPEDYYPVFVHAGHLQCDQAWWES